MWPTYGNHMAWMGIWWVLGLAVLTVLVLASLTRRGGRLENGGEDSPETILKRRYARGDMDRDDYERRLTELRR